MTRLPKRDDRFLTSRSAKQWQDVSDVFYLAVCRDGVSSERPLKYGGRSVLPVGVCFIGACLGEDVNYGALYLKRQPTPCFFKIRNHTMLVTGLPYKLNAHCLLLCHHRGSSRTQGSNVLLIKMLGTSRGSARYFFFQVSSFRCRLVYTESESTPPFR